MSRPASRSQLYALATGLLIVTCTLAWYAVHRQQVTDERTEKQRKAICAILANIPGQIPPEIANARKVFARHPGDCEPIRHPRATPTPTPGRAAGPTVIVVPSRGEASSSTPAPRPSPRPTQTHTPHPHPSRTGTPSPTPSPTHSCDLLHPLRCI